MEFSCLIFLNVSKTMLCLAKHLCLTFCSILFCSFEARRHKWDWDQSPWVSFFDLILFQLKSHFFAVLERILLCFFFLFCVIYGFFALVTETEKQYCEKESPVCYTK